MERFTNGTLMRGSTMNLLTPSPEGTRGAVVLCRHRSAMFGMCLPSDLWAEQMLAAPRPSDVAGSQQAVSTRNRSQDSCVNDTSAPLMKRCWAAVYTAVDVALGAAWLDVASNPVPAFYSIQLIDCAVALVVAVTATALVILRVRRRREGKAPPSSAGSTRGSSDLSLCPTDDSATPPPQPETRYRVQVLDAAVADSAEEGTGGIGAGGPGSPPRAPAELHQAPDNVVQLTGVVLGKGSFGCVLEGTYRGRTVAVKKLLGGMWCSPGSGQMLLQEIDVLGRCDHPNVVKLLAAYVMGTSEPVPVLERMDTSLDKMLYGSPGTLLPICLVLHIAIQIAQGLSYLHPTILHRDLKPANVLVSDPQGEAPLVKLSDFGLSRLRESVLVTVQPEAGTPPYVAPECFGTNVEAITHLADCYSFGVLLWEMLAGTRPWGGLSGVQVAYAVTITSQRLPLPAHDTPGRDVSRWPPRLRRLLWQCWEADPRRRPAAAEVVKALILTQEDLKHGNT